MPRSSAATRTREIARSLSESGSAAAAGASTATAEPAARRAAPPFAPFERNSALLISGFTLLDAPSYVRAWNRSALRNTLAAAPDGSPLATQTPSRSRFPQHTQLYHAMHRNVRDS